MDGELLFYSDREPTLRFATLACFTPVPLTTWLVSLGTRAEWQKDAGVLPWWLLPTGLVVFSLVLPAAICWLHDAYVLRLEHAGPRVRVTTFLLWGRRTHDLSLDELLKSTTTYDEGRFAHGAGPIVNAPSVRFRLPGGRRLIFDAQGDAPAGWPALYALANLDLAEK